MKLEPAGCETPARCATSPSSPAMGPPNKLAKLEPMVERAEPDQDWETGWALPIQEIDQGLSFVPVEPSEPDPGSPRHLIPNRRIAVSDILPLTLSSGQVCQTPSSLHPQHLAWTGFTGRRPHLLLPPNLANFHQDWRLGRRSRAGRRGRLPGHLRPPR